MIDHLRQMAIFARVVDEGSFRAAARGLNLAPSRVSQTVSDLEDYLGTTLLHRTTRKIALTSEGRIFYARVTDMLRSAESGLNELNALTLEPAGALRISVPAFLASSALTCAIAAFVREHPHVDLSVSYTDHRVDLLEDGFDLNIRVGWLEDSAMMSRKLGVFERLLVAGADYAASRPVPTHASELENWDWIRFEQIPKTMEFISPQNDTVKVVGNAQLQVDSAEAMYQYACHNLGAAVLPLHLAKRGLDSGALVQLLPDWTSARLGCYAVWPDTSRRETLTLRFVRFLVATGVSDAPRDT